jgi:hypothetical protein
VTGSDYGLVKTDEHGFEIDRHLIELPDQVLAYIAQKKIVIFYFFFE